MSAEDTFDHKPVFHYENGVPVFDPQRLDDLAREQEDAKKRDEKYKDDQLTVNRRMMIFTAVLAGCSILGGGISVWQAHTASVTAGAAKDNATAATGMVEEMKKSGNDTHELAVQAKNQAERTKDVADRALAQATATNKLAKTAHAIFLATDRPYIGVNASSMIFHALDEGGNYVPFARPSTKTVALRYVVEIKNFGPVPGTNYKDIQDVLLNGVEEDGVSLGARPATLWPGQVVYFSGDFGGDQYKGIMNGTIMLKIVVHIEYDGPGEHYKQCDTRVYNPLTNAFIALGACPD